MKKYSYVIGIFLLIALLPACRLKVPGSGKVEMKNTVDSVSYALGFMSANQFMMNFERIPFDTLDRKDLARAFSKSTLKKEYVEFMKNSFGEFNEEIYHTAFINKIAYNKSYFNEMDADIFLDGVYLARQRKLEEMHNAKADSNRVKDKAFLEENAKREGVIQLESGLQYEVLVEGNGQTPTENDVVKVHYRGTLIDGTVFDSSVERNEPAEFKVTDVIKGWQEALKMMPVGSKWKLYIPANLGYGENGSGEKIGPEETLIFEVELIAIK